MRIVHVLKANLALGLFMLCVPLLAKAQKPNVLLIVTDDQGYGDFSCHGNPVLHTPNLDQLYQESVRFTNYHVDPTCAPSRSALMTGKYAHHAGVWHTISGGNHLRSTETTMADLFKASGYRTGLFGKWHLGSNYPYRPMDRGFDEWLGQGDGGTGTTDDWFTNDRVNDRYWHNGTREYIEGYGPDVLFNAASKFIQADDAPFFVYLATYVPHHPHTVPDTTMVDKYAGAVSKYTAFFYAGIDRIDQNVGKILHALETSGKADNTIVVFMSDNGGTAGVQVFNAGMRGHKGQVYEGGHRVPLFIRWPKGKLKTGRDVSDLSAHIDVLPTLVDLCGLQGDNLPDFDGRSFKKQLLQPELKLAPRTLFVETQRTLVPHAWVKTAGMTNKWRLVDNKELYDMEKDPGQKQNVIDAHPDVVAKFREAHKTYWAHVSPGDRDAPRFVIGHPDDEETFLTPSDWHLEKTPWNHAQIAKGSKLAGDWNIRVYRQGTYRFELRRWPREAAANIAGVPVLHKTVDAWAESGGVDKLIYGSEMTALPVASMTLEVGDYSENKKVGSETKALVFELDLKKGDTHVKGLMLDKQGSLIGGAYYLYITKLP